jgi:hypothetical protein
MNRYDDEDPDDYGYDPDMHFADPGGNSALRASSPSNPRNLPCPNCRRPNLLTPADKARGYQCDSCADALEGGGGRYDY